MEKEEGKAVVKTFNLTKRFGNLVAVDDLSLEVYKGEVFGFLGPNGAGKTTTIRMLVGLLKPNAGRAEIFGHDTQKSLQQILRRTGVLVETPGFYPYLSGRDNLKILSRTSGIKENRIEEVLKIAGLSSRAGDKFKSYSQGMKQRLGIASALLNDPDLFILDEPTIGLDPKGMREMREFIRGLGDKGKTVFLSSHLLYEVEQICDRVAILKEGKVIAQGKVDELLKRGRFLQLKVPEPAQAIEILSKVDWIKSITREGDLVFVEALSQDASKVTAILAEKQIFVSEIRPKDETLEDFFFEIMEAEDHD